MASVDTLFCFPVQNLTKIGQSDAELWPKNDFSIWRPSAMLNFKNSYLCTSLTSSSKYADAYQISSKLDDISLRYGDVMIFKMAAICHLDFTKFAVCHMTSIYMLLCFTVQNLTEIGQSAAELRLNNYFAIWWPSAILISFMLLA